MFHTPKKKKMSNQVLQATRALAVIPSDDVNIPYPNVVLTGTSTGSGINTLVDSGANFINQGIKVGDTVLNEGAQTFATVVSVSATSLGMSNSNLDGAGASYVIYQGENTGCTLYVGVGGDLHFVTAGNDQSILMTVRAGTFIPIKSLKVLTTTTCTDIIALW